jgi:ATP-binding cassette, subfamily B, bacterial
VLRKLQESLRHFQKTAELVLRASRPQALGYLTLTLATSGLPLGIAFVGKHIIDAVVAGDKRLAVRLVLFELVLVVASATLGKALFALRQMLGARLGITINVAILEKAQRLTLSHFEDSEFYDRLTRARREASSRPLSLVTDALSFAQNVLTLTGYLLVLLSFSGWAALGLLAATVPATIAESRFAKQGFRLRNFRSPETRRLYYLESLLASDEHQKELKLFGTANLFLERYKELSEKAYDDDKKLSTKKAVVTQALATLATLSLYATYAVVAWQCAQGKITLGAMTLYVLSFRQGQGSFAGALSAIGSMYEHNLYMSNLFSFFAIEEPKRAALPAAGSTAATWTAVPRIVFEDVTFQYPGKDTPALSGVSLTIEPGQRIALVGPNGAGKTTLVKLLTRLYTPTKGRILIGERDLQTLRDDEVRELFGVVFQDFGQYQLLLRENVGVGSVDHMDDTARVERALSRGGGAELSKSLAGGLDAPLGRWFKDGVELSGGQWQRIALSRAFMREQAKVLVLDEPTAALDAEAEHAIFERFQELATGRTTFVVSHRFATVRKADRILVIEGGAVTEDGPHEALLKSGKLYAKLFALQAEGYK